MKYNIPPNLRVDRDVYLAHELDGGTSLDHEAQPVGGVGIEAGEVEQLSWSSPALLSLGNSYKEMTIRIIRFLFSIFLTLIMAYW